jgi:hypothetical protein
MATVGSSPKPLNERSAFHRALLNDVSGRRHPGQSIDKGWSEHRTDVRTMAMAAGCVAARKAVIDHFLHLAAEDTVELIGYRSLFEPRAKFATGPITAITGIRDPMPSMGTYTLPAGLLPLTSGKTESAHLNTSKTCSFTS